MPFDPVPALHQMTAEIKYNNGWTYFDRCGTAMLRLGKALGEPFRDGGNPSHVGEWKSDVERLTVQFGREHIVVTQNWVETTARFQMAARSTWGVLSKLLEVEKHVIRVGNRFWFVWAVTSGEEGEAILRRLGLFSPTDTWLENLGLPVPRHLSPTVLVPLEKFAHLRFSLDSAALEHRGYISKEFDRFVPKRAIILDLDFVLFEKDQELTERQLQGFLVDSWSRAQTLATNIGESLAACQ